MKLDKKKIALLAGVGVAAWWLMGNQTASASTTAPLFAVVSKDHVILSTWLQVANAKLDAAKHLGSFVLRIR